MIKLQWKIYNNIEMKSNFNYPLDSGGCKIKQKGNCSTSG